MPHFLFNTIGWDQGGTYSSLRAAKKGHIIR
jgi:hypothetical protein